MGVYEVITPIKKTTNINNQINMSKVNPCKTHGRKPDFVYPNRSKEWVLTECDSPACQCFAFITDIVAKWNKFNPSL